MPPDPIELATNLAYAKGATKSKMNFFQSHQRLNLSAYPGLEVHACRFNTNSYSDKLFGQHKISKPAHLARSAQSRKSEFLAGRYCAQLALSCLGIENTEIKKLPDQSPLWPEGLAGSISHSGDYAISAVAYKNTLPFIGVDCETIISSSTRHEIRDIVTNKRELELIADTFADLNLGITLALSAKESVFKAIFPAIKSHITFDDIEIVDISIDHKYLQVTYPERIAISLRTQALNIYFSDLDGNTIFTLLAT